MERYTDTISGEELYIHIGPGGSKNYYKDKELDIPHRVDGPAFESDDRGKMWYVNGNLHRLDGPALISAIDSKKWYVNGTFILEVNHKDKIIKRMS